MSVRSRRRYFLSRFVGPLATLTIMGYFAFHAFNGQYGIRADISMKSEIAQLETVLAARTTERDLLESRVSLLSGATIERDMADEQIRRALNLSRPDEIVIFLGDE